MEEGHVKWFNDKKGFGFIAADGRDVFVHITALKAAGLATLEENTPISFRLDTGPNGKPVAVDLKVLS